ncbi:MAG: zinc ribbon domain-containing protein [Oscillospiraceae bacterium]|nr:zinc ribbon domain-containing protein [Oscillospiraceae bacterium]
MKCQKCGTECPDGNLFCEACGAELETPVLPDNIDDKGRVKKVKRPRPAKAAKARPEKAAPAKERRVLTPEEREKRAAKVKAVFIGIGVIAVVVLVVVISHIIEQSKGLSAAQSIPLGRNVPYAASETGLEFNEKSANGLINSICDFDYICISEDTVKVNGSEQPRWAIMLTVDGEDIITAVEYYDFQQLKLNWKGRLMSEMLTQDSLEYGMSIRNVNKTLGLKPYYVRRSVSNDSLYCYRYYCSDPEEGYDRVFNYYVEFSDIELAVKGVRSSEVNYANAIFNAGPTSMATPVNISNEEEVPDENANNEDGEGEDGADEDGGNEDGENTEE